MTKHTKAQIFTCYIKCRSAGMVPKQEKFGRKDFSGAIILSMYNNKLLDDSLGTEKMRSLKLFHLLFQRNLLL